jgi:hypothetical protein
MSEQKRRFEAEDLDRRRHRRSGGGSRDVLGHRLSARQQGLRPARSCPATRYRRLAPRTLAIWPTSQPSGGVRSARPRARAAGARVPRLRPLRVRRPRRCTSAATPCRPAAAPCCRPAAAAAFRAAAAARGCARRPRLAAMFRPRAPDAVRGSPTPRLARCRLRRTPKPSPAVTPAGDAGRAAPALRH